ncbi:MAG TPA: hypothetical protein QGF58_22160 [Myxococcota bacterium]|nr:hypothetical protein [Myxococcota bacterium]
MLDADAAGATTWYPDLDRDRFTDPDGAFVECGTERPGYVREPSVLPDCDGRDPARIQRRSPEEEATGCSSAAQHDQAGPGSCWPW